MADDITLPGTGTKVDTVEQADGSHQQVIQVDGEIITALNELVGRLHILCNALTRSQPTAMGQTRVSIEEFATSLSSVSTVNSVAVVTTLTNLGFSTGGQTSSLGAVETILHANTSSSALAIYNNIKVT